ncbi:MAG: DNA-binding protein [Arcobacter sp.]|nr:DNA-binding protein [Arcobacter sp.]
MLTLLSTNDAAQKLGISVQGVHYRIKTKKLKSVVKDGKTFVYIELEDKQKEESLNFQKENNQEIIKVKDEQISLLKRAIRWMGFQHKNEIKRLEQNHNKLIDVFKSEVELLQKAYNEMQSLYRSKTFLDYKVPKQTKSQENYHERESNNITIRDFFALMKKHYKTNSEIKNLILDGIKSGDKRFSYDSQKKKLTIYKSNFQDLI